MKPPALLLHGLFGYGDERADTASWLSRAHEVIARDAPGHGENAADAGNDWASIRCPTLVVRALGDGIDTRRMLELQPEAALVELDGGHDVHLEDPDGWRAAIESFV